MMTALDDFWAALSLLLRPNDDKHNDAVIVEFSKMSQIPKSIVREKLDKATQSKEAH